MSELIPALERLRDAVARSGDGSAPELRLALDAPAFEMSAVSFRPDGELGHIAVELAEPVDVASLEAQFGPATTLPRGPSIGAPRMLLFASTLPPEGEASGTVLAELEASADEGGEGPGGAIRRLIVRRDVAD
jgi:hypothetical protein